MSTYPKGCITGSCEVHCGGSACYPHDTSKDTLIATLKRSKEDAWKTCTASDKAYRAERDKRKTLEAQLTALTKERDEANNKALRVVRGEFSQICSYCGWEANPNGAQWEELQAHVQQCEKHPASQLASSQAREAKLREALSGIYDNDDWTDSTWTDAHKALALPADDTALQQRLAEERERCADRVDDREMFGGAATVIRSMK